MAEPTRSRRRVVDSESLDQAQVSARGDNGRHSRHGIDRVDPSGSAAVANRADVDCAIRANGNLVQASICGERLHQGFYPCLVTLTYQSALVVVTICSIV